MRNKITSTVCAGLLAMGMSSASNAALIAMDFTSDTGYVSYVFDLQAGAVSGNVITVNDYTISLFSADINGTVYGASGNLSIQEGELTEFIVLNSGNTVVLSVMAFDGYLAYQNGTLDMVYYGDGNVYTGASYSFNSVTDAGTGKPIAMLVDQLAGGLNMTSVSVNTVSAVPVPAAVWLFGSGLIGLVGIARRKA